MNLVIKPEDVKKDIKIKEISTHLEFNNDVKMSEFFEVTLTHIESKLSSNSSGYNKIEVLTDCLKKLNDYVITNNFFENMPQENIEMSKEEFLNVIKENSKK